MTVRRRGVLRECDARTQGAPIWNISGRPRTKQRAAQHVPAAQGFIVIRVLSLTAFVVHAGEYGEQFADRVILRDRVAEREV